jgi:hypothetical protein
VHTNLRVPLQVVVHPMEIGIAAPVDEAHHRPPNVIQLARSCVRYCGSLTVGVLRKVLHVNDQVARGASGALQGRTAPEARGAMFISQSVLWIRGLAPASEWIGNRGAEMGT